MAKFLGAILTLVAAVGIAVSYFSWSARSQYVSPDFIDETAALMIDSSRGRAALAVEITEAISNQEGRVGELESVLGADARIRLNEAIALAVATPEFRSAYLDSTEQAKRVVAGDAERVTFDGRTAVEAVSGDADPAFAAAIPILPEDFFVIDLEASNELDDWPEVRSGLGTSAVVGVLAALLGLVGAIALYRSAGPFFALGWLLTPLAVLIFAVIRGVREEVLAEAADEGQLELIVGTEVIDRAQGVSLRFVFLALIPLAASAVKSLLKKLRRSSGTTPSGSDTDWATGQARDDGYPQIIS